MKIKVFLSLIGLCLTGCSTYKYNEKLDRVNIGDDIKVVNEHLGVPDTFTKVKGNYVARYITDNKDIGKLDEDIVYEKYYLIFDSNRKLTSIQLSKVENKKRNLFEVLFK